MISFLMVILSLSVTASWSHANADYSYFPMKNPSQNTRTQKRVPVVSTAVAGSCDKGLKAFKSTVYPFIREKCAYCHDRPATGVQGPDHATADPEHSYQRVSSYMNFDSIDSSQFLVKGGNNHCVGYGMQCGVTVANLKPVLQAWMDQGQKECPRSLKLISAAIPVPDKLPQPKDQAGEWMKIKFNLSSMGDDFAGTFLELEMQQFIVQTTEHAGAYRFRSPRLATRDQAFLMKGIYILVNGKLDPRENIFSSVNSKVNYHALRSDGSAKDFPLLSTKALIVIQEKATGDKISVGFDQLEPAANPVCSALDTYKKNVMPILTKRACFECHGGGDQDGTDPNAIIAMNLKGSDAKACSEALQRVNLFDPNLSPLILLPLRGMNDHPQFLPFPREVFPTWTDWINEEKKSEKTSAFY